MGDNGTGSSGDPRSQAWKSGYKEEIDEVSISARPQWELAAVAKRDQYNKLLQFPQPPLDIPWGAGQNGRGQGVKNKIDLNTHLANAYSATISQLI